MKTACLTFVAICAFVGMVLAQEKPVDTPVDGSIEWVIDLEEAQPLSQQTDQPLFIVFRCERWAAGSDFDGQVVSQDNEVAELAKQFIRARIQSMNGVDSNWFQFEYDLTRMLFFQNADGQTHARYGDREDGGPEF